MKFSYFFIGTSLFGNILKFTIFTSLFSQAYAIDNTPNKFIEVKGYVQSDNGCYVWKPSQPLGNSVKWTGACKDGYANGEGSAKWYNVKNLVSIYSGTFNHGKLKGKGKIEWKTKNCCDLDYYEGELKNSDPFFGKVQFTDGSQYSGEFVPQEGITTKGIKTFGKDSGFEGDRYEGEFLNFAMHGQGVYTWGDVSPWSGDKYVGEYRYNSRNRLGTYFFSNGDVYEGPWLNNQRSGLGEMVYADGSIYKGRWKNDWRSDYGEMTFTDGLIYKGLWENDITNGYARITYPNGTFYEGDVYDLERHGEGITTFKDGSTEEGTYLNDMQQGKFIIKSKDGSSTSKFYD